MARHEATICWFDQCLMIKIIHIFQDSGARFLCSLVRVIYLMCTHQTLHDSVQRYDLCHVELEIYDLLGRRVAQYMATGGRKYFDI